MKKALLVLEDGTYYIGKSFGKDGETYGEIVFNTSMTGYQEILTDPSNKGLIVLMTYPLIGNYGFNDEDNESTTPHVQGLIVKELCDMPSNWRNKGTPAEFLESSGVTGICDIDTRHLTQHIREHGSMYAVISTVNDDIDMLTQRAREFSGQSSDLVSMVTTKTIKHIEGSGHRVVVVDLGVRESIIKALENLNADIYIVPAGTPAEEILALNPDGILLSNGPGNPSNIPGVLDTVRNLIGKKPIMGICLGYLLLGLALGGSTYKLKFGHHGGNHPVKDIAKGRIYITSQSHNYALKDNLPQEVCVTHINVNDKSAEGFIHRDYPILGLQYLPRDAADPLDSEYGFGRFVELMENKKE